MPPPKFLNKESFRCRFLLFLLSGELVINSFCEGREVTKEFVCFVCLLRTEAPQSPGRATGCAFSFCTHQGTCISHYRRKRPDPSPSPSPFPQELLKLRPTGRPRSREREQSGHPPSDLKFNVTYGTEISTKLGGQSLRMNACPRCTAQLLPSLLPPPRGSQRTSAPACHAPLQNTC